MILTPDWEYITPPEDVFHSEPEAHRYYEETGTMPVAGFECIKGEPHRRIWYVKK